MIPQISDAELVLMKLLWRQGGSALYAELMEAPRTSSPGAGRRTPSSPCWPGWGKRGW